MNHASTLSITSEALVTTVTLNRPDRLNALNGGVLAELYALVSELEARPIETRPRVLVVTGAGERAFVAGADIAELSALDAPRALELSEAGHRLGHALDSASFVSIAAVNGFALGGGLELALACDIIYASDRARLGLPEINLGVIPGFGGTFRLAARVGIGAARRMIYSGDNVVAARALEMRLVDAVFPHAELLPRTQEFAQKLAQKAPLALAAAKQCLLVNASPDTPSAAEFEAARFSDLFKSADAHEGLAAFLAKRPPSFVGR